MRRQQHLQVTEQQEWKSVARELFGNNIPRLVGVSGMMLR